MIGVNPTKVQLANEDISEYEARKQTWSRVSRSDELKHNNVKPFTKSESQYRRKEVQTRIGAISD